MAAYNATSVRRGPLRRRLEALLGSVGEGTEPTAAVLCVDYGTHILIGARCFANFGLVALDVATITVGDDVQIGPNVPADADPPRRAKRVGTSGRPPSPSASGTTCGSVAASSCWRA